MRTKKEKVYRRIRNSVFGVYLVSSLIFFYFLNTDNVEQHKLFQEQLDAKNNVIDSVNHINDLQNKIILADNHYVTGEYEKAKEAYQELLADPKKTDDISKNINFRINRILEIEGNKDSLLTNIRDYQYSLRMARENEMQLHKQLDSIKVVYEKEKQSLNEKYEKAKQTIEEKNRRLNKKEKVQVISFKNNKGNLIHYLGEVKEGMANGGGVGIFETGGLYKGEWKDNQRHGKGTYTWKDGHKYEGTFVEGIREGQGTYYWSSGEKYTGEWKNNMRNGQGTLYDRDNNIQYEGLWVDDKVKK